MSYVPISMSPPGTFTTRGHTYPVNHQQWAFEMAEMVKSYIIGEPIFMRFTSKSKMREGSIGRVKSMSGWRGAVTKNGVSLDRPYYNWSFSSHTGATIQKPIKFMYGSDEYKIHPDRLGIVSCDLRWDGRTNKCSPYYVEIDWLKAYNGPTVWVYEKKEGPLVTAYDRLKHEVKVDDFICYILHHFNGYGASTQFGKVTKIDRDGTVWAKNVKLGDDEKSAEKRVKDNTTIVVLTPDLMDRLMMARLSIL